VSRLNEDAIISKTVKAKSKPNGKAGEPHTDAVFESDPITVLFTGASIAPVALVEDVLYDDTLTLLVAPEGAGKSFLGLDLAMCLAYGLAFHQKRVKQRPVLYIAGEGRLGVLRRIKAWLIYHGLDPDPAIHLSRTAMQLMSPDSTLRVCNWVRKCKAETTPNPVVFVDTISRNYGAGDESTARDMSQAVQHIDLIRGEGCTVVAPHHSPIDGARSRGSSVLPAAADSIYLLSNDADSGIITVTNSKSKDTEIIQPFRFKRHVIELGELDNFAKPVTSCVLVTTDEKPAQKQKRSAQLGRHQAKAMELLSAAGGSIDFPVLRRQLEDSGVGRSRTYEVIDSLEHAKMITNHNGRLREVRQ
jgi:hypothetical protein